MSDSGKKIRCSIVTPEARVVDADAVSVVIPAHDGLLGVMPGHAPLLCNLGAGLLQYTDTAKAEHTIYVEGGVGHVLDNEVTVLTSHAVSQDKMTIQDAKEQLIEAEAMPKSNTEEVEARNHAVQRAKYLIQLANGK